MRTILTSLFVCLLLPAVALRAEEPNHVLNADTYAELRDAIRPSAEERAWRDVGWLPSFGEAVVVAKREGKPLFLWAMNGHPLACT